MSGGLSASCFNLLEGNLLNERYPGGSLILSYGDYFIIYIDCFFGTFCSKYLGNDAKDVNEENEKN